MTNFDTAFAHAIDIDGGYAGDPRDPGGNINFGITEYMADRALHYAGHRNFDRFGRGWFKRLFQLAMT